MGGVSHEVAGMRSTEGLRGAGKRGTLSGEVGHSGGRAARRLWIRWTRLLHCYVLGKRGTRVAVASCSWSSPFSLWQPGARGAGGRVELMAFCSGPSARDTF